MKLKYTFLLGSLIMGSVVKVESLNGIQDCGQNAKNALQESLINKVQNWASNLKNEIVASDTFKKISNFTNNALPKNEQPDQIMIDNADIIEKIKSLPNRENHLFEFLGKLVTQSELDEEMKKFTVKPPMPSKIDVDQALFDRFIVNDAT